MRDVNLEKWQIDKLQRFLNLEDSSKIIYLGSGTEGTCYRVGRKTYKLYKQMYCDLLNNDIAIGRLKKFQDIIIENVYFIRELMYLDGMMIGSITDYASGISCKRAQLHRCKIDKLVKALSRLKGTVYELSELGIYIDDNFLGNFLYDGNNFKLIDMSSSYYSSEIPDSEILDDKDVATNDDVLVIYRKNMSRIMKKLFVNITNKYDEIDNFIFAFLWYIDSPYKSYLVDTDMMINPDDTIIGIRDTISEYIGYEIDTFSQCRNDLLRIRKRR